MIFVARPGPNQLRYMSIVLRRLGDVDDGSFQRVDPFLHIEVLHRGSANGQCRNRSIRVACVSAGTMKKHHFRVRSCSRTFACERGTLRDDRARLTT